VTLHIIETYNTYSWYTGSVNAGASPQAHKWRGKTGARYDDEEKQQPARATVSRDKTARFASCAPHASAQLLSRPCPRARGSAGSLACVANLAANATRLARTTISAATGTLERQDGSGLPALSGRGTDPRVHGLWSTGGRLLLSVLTKAGAGLTWSEFPVHTLEMGTFLRPENRCMTIGEVPTRHGLAMSQATFTRTCLPQRIEEISTRETKLSVSELRTGEKNRLRRDALLDVE
jgi:hypothetical protein